jgi:hypothetical protein
MPETIQRKRPQEARLAFVSTFWLQIMIGVQDGLLCIFIPSKISTSAGRGHSLCLCCIKALYLDSLGESVVALLDWLFVKTTWKALT